MQNILVTTDFSNNAYSALLYATRLFQDQACQFYLLHTFNVNTPVLTSRINTDKGDLLYQRLHSESKEKLTEMRHKIVRDTEDLQHTFEMISVSKGLSETINKTITNKNIDLVVMGTKGATGAKEVFIGSNTVKVIQKIKSCPVLVIPDQFDFSKPLEIVFPTDFKQFYLEKELQPLIAIASLFKSNIRIFHVHEEEKLSEIQEYNFETLKKYLKDFEVTTHWISKLSKKTKLINEFIKKMQINVLVMINYKHNIIEGITHEPVIKNIGFHATVPFLVIPDAS